MSVPVSGQAVRPVLRLGFGASTPVLEDLIASPALRERFGNDLAESAEAQVAPGVLVEAGAELQVRPTVRLRGMASWQPSTLEVDEGAGAREVQDVSLLGGLVEAGFQVLPRLELSLGVGVLSYRSEEGIFDQGSDTTPLLRGGAAWELGWGGHAVRLGAFAEGHNFGTPLIRQLGGENGQVARYGIQLALVWGGAR